METDTMKGETLFQLFQKAAEEVWDPTDARWFRIVGVAVYPAEDATGWEMTVTFCDCKDCKEADIF